MWTSFPPRVDEISRTQGLHHTGCISDPLIYPSITTSSAQVRETVHKTGRSAGALQMTTGSRLRFFTWSGCYDSVNFGMDQRQAPGMSLVR
jgi:hypothetical protein